MTTLLFTLEHLIKQLSPFAVLFLHRCARNESMNINPHDAYIYGATSIKAIKEIRVWFLFLLMQRLTRISSLLIHLSRHDSILHLFWFV